MAKRSGKFYYRNERETMERLGLKQVPGSGNGWVSKEDGENENVLCQLKSTDSLSYRVDIRDVNALLHNASVTHKVPVFAIQFLQTDDVFLLARPIDVPELARYIETGVASSDENGIIDVDQDHGSRDKLPVIKSSMRARESFNRDNEKKWKKKERSAT